MLFEILVSIFERAYILVYEERMGRQSARLWSTWEDYMRAWCRRGDFREVLPQLLEGEDPDFQTDRQSEIAHPGSHGGAGAPGWQPGK